MIKISPHVYDIIEDTHMVYGLMSNTLLMYAIIRFTRKSLGVYKQLQMIFAGFDFFLVTQHIILKPRVMVVETTIFGVAADWNSRHATCFYCCCNTMPFILMIIDFLYRYWSIARPHLISLFKVKKFIALLAFIPMAEFTFWYYLGVEVLTGKGPEIAKTLLAEESGRRLDKPMIEGWLIMHHWENGELNVQQLFSLMCFNSIMGVCLSIAIILGSLTYYHIYVLSNNAISAHALYMQRKLFVSVCAQTTIPLVFVYIPYICVLNLPFFKLPVFFWDDACMLLTSCFPAWDAMIVIVLMPDYWKGLVRMLFKDRPSRQEVTSISNPTVPTATSRK